MSALPDPADPPPSPAPQAPDPGASQENIRAILNGLPALVGYWDRDLRNRMANDAYVEFFGMTPEQIHGMHISEVLGPELYAKNLPYMQRALAGEEQLFDREIPTPSGERRYTQASYIPDVVDDEVRGFFVLVTDITARHRAEVALHASEERYRALVEHLPRSAITLVGSDLTLRWLGGGVARDAGLDPEALVGRPVRETSGGGEHGARVEALYAMALAGEEVSAELHSKVTGRDFSVEIAPLRAADGTITAALGVAQDVTERLRAQAALRLQSQITENMAEGALLIRAADLVIVHANAAAEAMFGYGPGELVGVNASELHLAEAGGDPRELAGRILDELTDEHPTWSGDLPSVRRDGTTFWRRTTISAFEHPEEGTLLVSVLSDVTEEREREAEEKALAEIATLVAQGVGPAGVLAAVAREIQGFLEARYAVVARFDHAARQAVVLGGRTADGVELVGATTDLDGPSATAAVFRTGGPARSDDAKPGIDGRPVRGGIAAPIVIGGTLWGAVAAAFDDRAVPAGAELRLGRFAHLVALAIANAEAWETLARQAATDAVTGIANHRTFHERLHAEVERARRYGRDLSLVLFDVDHFKQVNDRYGHQAGDRVLAEVARRLQEQAREGELVARIGGEEFAWLMPETGQDGAYVAADRVRRAVAAEPFDDGVGTVTVSAGVCASEHGHDAEDLVRFADRALYWAKDSGRNTTFVYTEEARDALAREGRQAERFQAMSSVRALARAIDSKDWSTHRHSERVADLAERLAVELGWTTKRARLLHACGLLHDVGKIGIPDSILLRPGPLTPEEYEEVKRHAAMSAYIAAEVLEAEQVAWIRGHHERWDGGGYPDALAGADIPDGAQILALADSWDVMTENRTYQATKTVDEALEECRRERGRQFAPRAVDALVALAARGVLGARPAPTAPPRG